jgi:hypothetical protein
MEVKVPHKHWYTFTILYDVTTHGNVTSENLKSNKTEQVASPNI